MKQKTHQAMFKRVRFTANGLVIHKPAAVSHLRVNKSPRRTAMVAVLSTEKKHLAKMLPYQM